MEQTINRQLLDFLDRSPSCYHAVANLAELLDGAGYTRLQEFQPWQLNRGGKYYVTRGDSSILAFRLPQGKAVGFQMAAAHSDSPTFKVREVAELPSAGGTIRLSVEPYGGSIFRSWLDRPLSVAGRVAVSVGDRVETRLVNIDRDLLVIPSVAIHMNRAINQGVALDPAVDLPPLYAMGETGSFRAAVAQAAGVEENQLLSTELVLYPRTKGTVLGAHGEFIASPRLDDLQCAFGCTMGFLAGKETDTVPLLCVFNNEEVGSGTRQGADSTFLTDVVERICHALGCDTEQRMTMAANSFLVSADNAHSIHPAHPEYADKQEYPVLNGGIVVKYNAAQKYTTDVESAAVFCKLCKDAGVPTQRYSNRADLPGGSTLGNISTAHYSVPAVDIGMPQLAMHSCYETAGAEDTAYLVQAMTSYFSRSITRAEEGGYRLEKI